MDPDKALKFLSDNLAEWSRVVVQTLLFPTSRYAEVAAGISEESPRLDQSPRTSELWLNPRLLWFATFSAILGTILNGLLPGRVQAPSLLSSVVVLVIAWIFYGSIAHLLCRIMLGRADFVSTLSLSLQVSATLYVVVSFVSLVATTLLSVPAIAKLVSSVPLIGPSIANEPALSFFIVGTVLTSIYQPLALRKLHRFGWFRTAFLAVIPYCTVWFSIELYRKLGIMFGSILSSPFPR